MDNDSANLRWLMKLLRNEIGRLRVKISTWYKADPPFLRYVRCHAKFFLRVVFVLLCPLILFLVIYSNISTLRGCFNPISESSVSITQQASDILANTYRAIGALNPPVQLFGDWLTYEISVHNASRVAFAIKRSDGSVTDYKEGPVTLLIQTDQASTTVGYDEDKVIAKGISLPSIPQYRIAISSEFGVDDWNAKVSKGEPVGMQINVNHGDTCLTVHLETNPYLFLIYVECWVVFMGLILLLKEAITLICKGFGSYFTSG